MEYRSFHLNIIKSYLKTHLLPERILRVIIIGRKPFFYQ